MPSTLQTIEMDAEEVLKVIDTVLPWVEKYVPAVSAVGGPIGVGVSLAANLLPLIEDIPVDTVYTAAVQADYRSRVARVLLLDFSGPEWQKSTPPTPTPVPGPTPKPPGA